VIGPGLPSPMARPSRLVTAMTSAAVPVRKHSSATYRSCRSKVVSATEFRLAGQPDDGVARDAFQNAGVNRRRLERPLYTMKMLSPVHSATLPLVIEHQGLDAAGVHPSSCQILLR